MDSSICSSFISHPLIKQGEIEVRDYQLTLSEIAKEKSTLVVLPTGLGKTVIALLVLVDRLNTLDGKVLFLSPTKPLVEQHAAFLRNVLTIEEDEIFVATGEISPEKRVENWKKAKIIVATPQVIENDLLTRRINLRDIVLVIFDECHRAHGNYAYVYIASRYREDGKNRLVLGITASPGSSAAKIQEVCENLGIEQVEIRSEDDPDILPYIFRKEIEWVRVEPPREIVQLKALLDELFLDRVRKLADVGFHLYKGKKTSTMELLELQSRIQARLREQQHPRFYRAASLEAELLKIRHAIDLVETQGVDALRKYFKRLLNEANSRAATKASKRLIRDPMFIRALNMAEELDLEHPKLKRLTGIVEREIRRKPESRIIIFTNFRDSAEMVRSALEEIEGVRPLRFIGQASRMGDKGLSQKKQVELIEKFKAGVYNVMVATSVAEEGLDIPMADLVIFYEPVPSEIRNIQRRGRTGRRRAGRIIILITRETKDEAYYWISRQKERMMKKGMDEIKHNESDFLDPGVPEEDGQEIEREEGPLVFVDNRETRSQVVKSLERLGCKLNFKKLEVGDYVVSERVCIERKSAEDLVDSLVGSDTNIFEQLGNLRREYERPILIIEGDVLHKTERVSENAIKGAIVSIAVDFSIPILYTRDGSDTANLIAQIAKREQDRSKRSFSPHSKKSSRSLKEEQEYVISSISNIGPVSARNLLKHFGSVENVINATVDELVKVERIGKVTAGKIREIVGAKYE
ncbi:MAG: DEAD/DEAH box helicase [Candidatus Syntrophoarchaeum sp.]|nr:DEAD/DEAH box helicase [Candidatus Syntrophoarchaeum sp.]